jgi:hypothetical protein
LVAAASALRKSLDTFPPLHYIFLNYLLRRRIVTQNKMVVRYMDGRVLKGFTADFMPNREIFHLLPLDAHPDAHAQMVKVQECKALFFVKDFAGNPAHDDKKEFEPGKAVVGRKIKVLFKDNELMVGTTQGYQPGRPGFFVFPADANSNNDRCFVVSAAAQDVSFL